MKVFHALLAACLLVAVAVGLSGWEHGNGATAGCPFGISADGCTAGQTDATSGLMATGPPVANANTIQHTDFFTGGYARQSGQTWGNSGGTGCTNTNCHPPWNVAGVDYPVGPHSGISFKDPTSATLPTGCSYCPANDATAPCVNIDRQEVACAGHASYDIEDFNFASTAQGCVALDIVSSTGGGTLTIKDNIFGNTPGCYSPTHHNFSTIFSDLNAFATANFSYNYSNGNGHDTTANTNYLFTLDISGPTSIIVTYNAIYNSVANAIHVSPAANGSLTVLYNYLEGLYCHNGAHCHYSFLGGDGVNVTNMFYGYNTHLADNGDDGGTAQDWTDLNVDNVTVTNWDHYNNVLVDNTLANDVTNCGGQCTWNALMLSETGNITHANVNNNYFDSTGWLGGAGGVNQCMEEGSGTNSAGQSTSISNGSPTISGFTNLSAFFTGMLLYANTGIPANTTASTIGANTITMSANATANSSETIYAAVAPLPTFSLSGNVNMLNGKSVNSLTQDLTTGVYNSATVGGAC